MKDIFFLYFEVFVIDKEFKKAKSKCIYNNREKWRTGLKFILLKFTIVIHYYFGILLTFQKSEIKNKLYFLIITFLVNSCSPLNFNYYYYCILNYAQQQ